MLAIWGVGYTIDYQSERQSYSRLPYDLYFASTVHLSKRAFFWGVVSLPWLSLIEFIPQNIIRTVHTRQKVDVYLIERGLPLDSYKPCRDHTNQNTVARPLE